MKLREFKLRIDNTREFLELETPIPYLYLHSLCNSLNQESTFLNYYIRDYIYIDANLMLSIFSDLNIDKLNSKHLEKINISQYFNYLFRPYTMIKSFKVIHLINAEGYNGNMYQWLGHLDQDHLESRILYLDAFEAYILSYKLYEDIKLLKV